MTRLDHTGRFAMLRGNLLEMPRGAALDVSCGAGTLWVTLDNDIRDIVLTPGDAVCVPRGKRALVHALDDAVLELREASAACA
jgi:hypothetical protein